MTLFSAFKEHRAKTRIAKKREAVQLAAERLANAMGNVHYAKHMFAFYSDQLEAVDQHQDYWRFAELRQKQDDTAEELARYEQIVKERAAQLAALSKKEKQ